MSNNPRTAHINFDDGTTRALVYVGFGIPADQPMFVGFLMYDGAEVLFNQNKIVSIELEPVKTPQIVVPNTTLIT